MATDQKLDASSIPLSSIKGVGQKLTESFMKIGIKSVEDLLFHLPIGYQDRTKLSKIAELVPEQEFVIRGSIEKVSQTFVPRKMLLVKVKDNTGHIFLRFFYYFPGLRKFFKEGSQMQIMGTSRLGRYGLETIHPEYELVSNELFVPSILPKYTLTKGLSQQRIRKTINEAIRLLKDKMIFIDDLLPNNNFQSLENALSRIHNPNSEDKIEDFLIGGASTFRKRIALEEIVANKISYLSVKEQNKSREAEVFENNFFAKKITENLDFSLTDDQKKAYREISSDLVKGSPMLRLLQGDVGSGKTIVAAIIAAHVVASDKQVAILAPTTILAKQHFDNFSNWFKDIAEVEMITSKILAADKKRKLRSIASGKAKLVIGTHAIFQKDTKFKNLSLVIYDEQHRFGVGQRLKLKEKAASFPHQLLLSATPIPRTMAMTVLSGLEISTIKSLPPNRKPIVTTSLSNDRRPALIQRIKEAISKGSQVYWVCPKIEEGESDLVSVEDLENILKKEFKKDEYEILHGKMKDKEKGDILERFKSEQIKILLATTVIEVGIDAPDANIMVIENSERFGLSQLHQLRGRVGRGTKESFCILMHKDEMSEIAKQRLSIIKETNDGFVVAEEDLNLRGPGDILGLSQTGLPSFMFYDLLADKELQEESNKIAKEVIMFPQSKQKKIIERWFPAHLELSDV